MRVLKLEPMFAVEAKKRMKLGGGDKKSGKANLPYPISDTKQARAQAADVVSVRIGTSGTTPFLFEYRH